MPGLTLGIAPLLIGFVLGHVGLFLFGIFFSIAAMGDFTIVYLIRKEPASAWVQDHPDKIGCIVYEKG